MTAGIVVLVIAFVVVSILFGRKHLGGTSLGGGKTIVSIKGATIVVGLKTHPLAGVEAQAVGAKGKKREHLLVLTGPTWSKTVVFNDLGKATLAARRINEAVRKT